MTTFITALRRNANILATVLGASVIGLAFALPAAASAALLTQQLDPGMQNADVTSLQTFLSATPTWYPSGTRYRVLRCADDRGSFRIPNS